MISGLYLTDFGTMIFKTYFCCRSRYRSLDQPIKVSYTTKCLKPFTSEMPKAENNLFTILIKSLVSEVQGYQIRSLGCYQALKRIQIQGCQFNFTYKRLEDKMLYVAFVKYNQFKKNIVPFGYGILAKWVHAVQVQHENT